MKMLLIAGHGASDPGAVGTVDGVTYREATLTREVVAGLQKALSGYAEVAVYDTGRNAYADYKAGALRTLAQFSKYDYVLEIHFNAFKADRGDGKTKGVECWVTKAEKGVAVEEAMVKEVAALGFANRRVKRTDDLAVIRTAKQSGVSAALLEVCFIDDADDMRLYLSKKQQVAQAVANGIIKGFGLKKAVDPVEAARKAVQEKAGLSDGTMAYLAGYRFAEDLLLKLAAAMK